MTVTKIEIITGPEADKLIRDREEMTVRLIKRDNRRKAKRGTIPEDVRKITNLMCAIYTELSIKSGRTVESLVKDPSISDRVYASACKSLGM